MYTKQVRSSTAYTVKGNVKLILEMVDPDILVSKITTSYIRSKFEAVMFGDRNISTTYARSIRTRLKSIFQYACEHGYLTENPINNFRLPKKKENVKQISEFFLEEDELNKV
ncbi:phage integrase SAM-like domain-containing protein, partial [Pseudolactococcus raffinolactis]